MKLTKSKLKQLIKEELTKITEQGSDVGNPNVAAQVQSAVDALNGAAGSKSQKEFNINLSKAVEELINGLANLNSFGSGEQHPGRGAEESPV